VIQSLEKRERRLVIMSFASLIECGHFREGGYKTMINQSRGVGIQGCHDGDSCHGRVDQVREAGRGRGIGTFLASYRHQSTGIYK
jgi:hypothetical protein